MNLDAAQDRRKDSILCSKHEILWEGRVVVSPAVRARLPRFLLPIVGLVVISLAALPAPARAEFPQPQGRVNDFAAVLDEGAKTELASIIREAEAAGSTEIAVVTVPSLDGMTVEEYAQKLFAAWGIGKKGVDNGVLVLVAPKDRTMRIEVGYGLEPVLPDSLAGSIIRSEFTPAFKEGDYRAGILKGVSRVAGIVRENHRLTPEQRKALQASTKPNKEEPFGEKLAGFLFLFFMFGFPFACGCWGFGSGIRIKEANAVILGLAFAGLFGGVPLLVVVAKGSAKDILLFLLALLPVAVLTVVGGYRKPLRFVGKSRGQGGVSSPGDWSSSSGGSDSGGGSSGGGGADFGGGSSGGGGASGKW
jgi:uncharacterized protein